MFEGFLNFLKTNEFLSGGGVLMILGAMMVGLRTIPGRVSRLFVRRFVATYEIRNTDDAFYWIQAWLSDHPYSKKTRLVWVTTGSDSRSSRTGDEVKAENSIDVRPRFYFSPAPGSHLIKHNNKWFYLDRAQKEPISGQETNSITSLLQQESFVIRTFSWNAKHIRTLLAEIRDFALPPDNPKVRILVPASYDGWLNACRKPRRSYDSVILQDGMVNRIRNDINEFFESKSWYRKLGIPHRRGYLLYGPPGSGKTSLVHAVASEIRTDVRVMSLASAMTDAKLAYLMASLDQKAVFLIEDIDCVFVQREKTHDADKGLSVTFSGLLNALDGVASSEGRILFMTTNHVDKLDPALIRPGRIDMKLYFGYADQHQARTLFNRFYENEADRADPFAARLPENTSMAALQDLLIRYRYDPEGAVKEIVNVTGYYAGYAGQSAREAAGWRPDNEAVAVGGKR